jgi:hypothetical protein
VEPGRERAEQPAPEERAAGPGKFNQTEQRDERNQREEAAGEGRERQRQPDGRAEQNQGLPDQSFTSARSALER